MTKIDDSQLVRLPVYMTDGLRQRLKLLAVRQRTNTSDLVRKAIFYYLDKHPDARPE